MHLLNPCNMFTYVQCLPLTNIDISVSDHVLYVSCLVLFISVFDFQIFKTQSVTCNVGIFFQEET